LGPCRRLFGRATGVAGRGHMGGEISPPIRQCGRSRPRSTELGVRALVDCAGRLRFLFGSYRHQGNCSEGKRFSGSRRSWPPRWPSGLSSSGKQGEMGRITAQWSEVAIHDEQAGQERGERASVRRRRSVEPTAQRVHREESSGCILAAKGSLGPIPATHDRSVRPSRGGQPSAERPPGQSQKKPGGVRNSRTGIRDPRPAGPSRVACRRNQREAICGGDHDEKRRPGRCLVGPALTFAHAPGAPLRHASPSASREPPRRRHEHF